MDKLFINKFKIDDSFVTMVYERNKIKTTKEFTRRYENITEDLQKAIDKMKYHLLDICMSEFISARTLNDKPYIEDWQLKRVRFYGITFTFYDKSLNGAVISGGYELLKGTGVINLNTPHRIIDHYNAACTGDDGQLMSIEMIADVKELYKQVDLYLGGNRVERQPELEGMDISIDKMRDAIRERLKLSNENCDNWLLKYVPIIDIMEDDKIKLLYEECFPAELKPKKKLKAKISKCLSIPAEQIEITTSLDEVAS